MKGVILFPSSHKKSPVTWDRYFTLFKSLAEEISFSIKISDEIDVSTVSEDVVMTVKSPQKRFPDRFSNLVDLPLNKKLIMFCTDLHGGVEFKTKLRDLFDRADMILCPYDFAFRRDYPEYLNKYKFFPQFVSPYKTIFDEIKFNKHPIKKCLLSGSIERSYPFRTKIFFQYSDSDLIDVLLHPSRFSFTRAKTGIKLGINYLKELNKYLCAISTASRFSYPLAKYVEIPSTGCLLLGEYVPELDLMGFKHGENYIRISKEDNLLLTLKEILSDTKKYKEIRKAGMELVMSSHTDVNRINMFKKFLKGI